MRPEKKIWKKNPKMRPRFSHRTQSGCPILVCVLQDDVKFSALSKRTLCSNTDTDNLRY